MLLLYRYVSMRLTAAQTGNAGFLPVGKLLHGQAQEATNNTRLPDNQIMRQICFHPALVLDDEIRFAIR